MNRLPTANMPAMWGMTIRNAPTSCPTVMCGIEIPLIPARSCRIPKMTARPILSLNMESRHGVPVLAAHPFRGRAGPPGVMAAIPARSDSCPPCRPSASPGRAGTEPPRPDDSRRAAPEKRRSQRAAARRPPQARFAPRSARCRHAPLSEQGRPDRRARAPRSAQPGSPQAHAVRPDPDASRPFRPKHFPGRMFVLPHNPVVSR